MLCLQTASLRATEAAKSNDCATGLSLCNRLATSLEQENTLLKAQLKQVEAQSKPWLPDWAIFGAGFIAAAVGYGMLHK